MTTKKDDGGFDLPVAGGVIHVAPGLGATIRLDYVADEAPPVEPPVDGPPAIDGDGSALAPPGAPQAPDLLAGLAVVPNWRVAGVNYRVGPHAKPDLTPIPIPGFVEVEGAVVRIVGDGVTLSGLDLTGYNVVVNGHRARITDCLLRVGSSRSWYAVQVYGDECVIDYCEFDGRGDTTDQSGLVAVYGRNPVFMYNHCHDFAQHALEMVEADGVETTLDYRYNLFQRGGCGSGAHLNVLQWHSGVVTNAVVRHNTVDQEKQAAAGEAIQFYGNGAGWECRAGEVARNVFVSSGGDLGNDDPAISYFLNLSAGTGEACENFFDLRSAYGWLYPGSSWGFADNVDMVTGDRLDA